MDIHSLIETLKKLDESSRLGIQIPPELREILDRTNQAIDAFLQASQEEINAFLQASQEEINSKERDSSLEQMLLFLWIVFFKNVLEKNDEYYQTFELYNSMLFNGKDYGKMVVFTDIQEKIRAIHKMLIESWPHMVPPQIDDINFPDSHLKNDMIYEYAGEHRKVEMKPVYGFVEPPSLKPDARLLSIEEYLATEYNFDDDNCINDRKVVDFANYIKNPENKFYDPHESDRTFLSDVVKKYGSNRYLDVYQKFRGLLSDYHEANW